VVPRFLQEQILFSLRHFPAVLLTGARQVGKSTLASSLIGPSWKARYITLDDRAVLDAVLRDPDGFLAGLDPPLVLDEVQRAPDLLRAVKKTIDRNRVPGQFLLTGSANLMTLAGVAETLAGRVALHTLHPFTWAEIRQRPCPSTLKALFEARDVKTLQKQLPSKPQQNHRASLIENIVRGGFPPAAFAASDEVRTVWFSSYRQTYIEWDILSLKALEHLPDFSRLLSLAAFRTGRLLNLSDFARETGLPFTTLRRYMNILQTTYQVFLIQPYSGHPAKRLVKTPKLFFNDTGLACHLIGSSEWTDLDRMGQTGSLVETWVAAELTKLMSVTDPRFRLFFWRTRTGQEVDFIVERGSRVAAVEVKWSARIDDSAVRTLDRCVREIGDRAALSVILYSGDETVPLSSRMIAIPFAVFFGAAQDTE
jgi:predicted AAA+ superfamily ATPase